MTSSRRSRTGRSVSTTPPFYAFPVTCGITFTFGGLRITTDKAVVVTNEGRPIPGLYAAGRSWAGCSSTTIPEEPALTAGRSRPPLAGRRQPSTAAADRQRSACRQRLRERLISVTRPCGREPVTAP